ERRGRKMKLKIGNKEYSIKYGYKPTLKSRVISKVVKMSGISNNDGSVDMEKVEDLLLFLPELLLVGLQVNHKEFRYDLDTETDKPEMLERAFTLVEEYMNSEDADIMKFFGTLQEALLQDSFLKSLFQKEQKKAERAEIMEISGKIELAEEN
ncbi:MAG: hypothetical protein NC548_62940, partial [Lachnospiraceae bacterium]|nr:hypothetical protein [Lachnospiraceae bacterium]